MTSAPIKNSHSDTSPVERLFFLSAIVFGLLCPLVYFKFQNTAFDLQFLDTFYVLPVFAIPILFAFFFIFQALIYFTFRKIKFELFASLGRAHFWFILLASLLLIKDIFFPFPPPGGFYFSVDGTSPPQTLFWTSVVLALLSLLMLVLNFGASLIGWILTRRK